MDSIKRLKMRTNNGTVLTVQNEDGFIGEAGFV